MKPRKSTETWQRFAEFLEVPSPTRYNNTLSGLQYVFEVPKDAGMKFFGMLETLGGGDHANCTANP
jgi:hypothetical protein